MSLLEYEHTKLLRFGSLNFYFSYLMCVIKDCFFLIKLHFVLFNFSEKNKIKSDDEECANNFLFLYYILKHPCASSSETYVPITERFVTIVGIIITLNK